MHCLIFGFGYMGKIRYRVLREHPDVDRITVVDPGVDVEKANMNGVLLPAGAPIPWSDVDAVFVCTPNNVTAQLSVQALKNCGNVFCEKPPGRDWDDFATIAEAAAETPDHCLMFGFNHRLHPSILAAKSLIGAEGLGNPLYVKATYGKSGGVAYRESWRNKMELSGGGILIDQGIHMLDLFQFLIGPMRVTDALMVDAFWGCGVEDNAFVLLRSESGVPAFLHSSATLWKHSFRLEVGCRDGYLIASGLLSKTGSYGREQLVIGKRQFEDEAMAVGNPREEIIHFDRDESWDREVNEFIAAVKEKRQPVHGTLDDARRVMEVIRDAYAIGAKIERPG
jgi:predicted dehydrogenase